MGNPKYMPLMKRGMVSKVYLCSLYNKINHSEISKIVYSNPQPNLHKIICARDRLIELGYMKTVSLSHKIGSKHKLSDNNDLRKNYHRNSVLLESDLTPFFVFAKDQGQPLNKREFHILETLFREFKHYFHKQLKCSLYKGKFNAMYLLSVYFDFLLYDFEIRSNLSLMKKLMPRTSIEKQGDILVSIQEKTRNLSNLFYNEASFITDLTLEMK